MHKLPKTKHTPGPWSLTLHYDGFGLKENLNGVSFHGNAGTKQRPGLGKSIATFYTNDLKLDNQNSYSEDEVLCNAHLISAAPELLEACKKLVSRATQSEENITPFIEARLAIAKAEGRA